ncbi:MAG: hypothetical protein EBU31_17560, partial [Proteobacteria bacterium]|nr:hypothetical protein [Pseudomonadota bacterium]
MVLARCRRAAAMLACVAAASLAPGAAAQAVPDAVELSPAVRAALQSAALNDAERAALRLRHGTWDDGDLVTAADRAVAALERWDLESAALADAAAPAALRGEALVRAGKPQDALALLASATDSRGLLVRAMALDGLGRSAEAIASAQQAKAAGEREGATRDA